MKPTSRHCDDYIDDPEAPECLRRWLHYQRLSPVLKRPDLHQSSPERLEDVKKWILPEHHQYIWTDPEPVLFADLAGNRVRCVMASRFGDVGVTHDLTGERYSRRVPVCLLSNFSINATES